MITPGNIVNATLRFARNASLVLLITLLLMELALRAVGFSRVVLYEPDPLLGWSGRAGAEGVYRDEGHSAVRISSAGVRDRERTKEKPADTWRIAVLGDSYTEALQVSEDKRFTSVMERLLAECGAGDGRRPEVLNFGISGFGTVQEYLLLQDRVFRYSPDVVVLAFLPGNDITDNVRAFDSSQPSRPFATLSATGQIVWDRSFEDSRSFRFKSGAVYRAALRVSDYSRVVQATFSVRDLWRRKRAFEADRRRARERTENVAEAGLSSGAYNTPQTPEWQHAWKLAERLIEEMNRLTAQKGAQFLLVTLSSGFQVHPDALRSAGNRGESDRPNPFYADDRLQAFAAQRGIEIVSLARPLALYAQRNKVFLHGFPSAGRGFSINTNILGSGHWNEEGHRLAGDLIARHLCRENRMAGGSAALARLPVR